jgi:simple sugar transport system ATP-binding protein
LPLLSIVNISKRFGDIVALDNVSLDIEKGEILGILGENGSGKSTLAKIIYGLYTPDSGYIALYRDGFPKRVFFSSPREAISNGIVMISQRPQLIEELSIVDNVALFLGVSRSKAKKILGSIMDRFSIQLDIERTVNTLSYTEKQFVELVKALSFKPKLLIVDEATTYLPRDVKTKFYDVLKIFTSLEGSVIFITHKIPEAVQVCDRIAVLRKGKLVDIFSKGDGVSVDVIRKAMFNEDSRRAVIYKMDTVISKHEGVDLETVLKVQNLVVLDDYGRRAIDNVNIGLPKGYVLAIVGIAGNGQKELCEGIAGLRKVVSGKIFLENRDVTDLGASERVARGLMYIPEDPFRDSVALDLTIAENLRLFTKNTLRREDVEKVLNELKVYPQNSKLKVYKLSGGNVQKISMARLMLSKPRCVVVHNPTRMLDEASSAFVKLYLKNLAKDGCGVLVVSEDIDEVLDIADEIAVISRGKIVKSFNVIDPSVREEIEKAMTIYA